MNRSKYLAQYLKGKGYLTKYGGVEGYGDEEKNKHYRWVEATQKQVDWADILIVVRGKFKISLKKKYKVGKKKIITLEVVDSKKLIPEKFADLRDLSYWDFQKAWTYPQLRKAIKPYLPLKVK